jgi:hypothetical protein
MEFLLDPEGVVRTAFLELYRHDVPPLSSWVAGSESFAIGGSQPGATYYPFWRTKAKIAPHFSISARCSLRLSLVSISASSAPVSL